MKDERILGVLMPLGGGDPVPLKKNEVVVGRRPSADIRLDFENVSGRHCMLSFANGTWHVRDLGSTNGTKVNGQKLQREQGIMPDDELAVATHLFRLDYEPAASFKDSQMMLEDEEAIQATDAHRPTSLMELAGFSDEGSPRPRPSPRPEPARPAPRDPREPGPARDLDEVVPDDFGGQAPSPAVGDDDFLDLIEDEIKRKQD